MHIGFITHVNMSQLSEFLYSEDSKRASKIKGSQNSPLLNTLPAWLKTENHISIFSFEKDIRETEFHGDNLSVYLVPARTIGIVPWATFFMTERKRIVPIIKRVQPDVLLSQWLHTGHALAALDSGIQNVCTVRATPLRYAFENLTFNPISWLFQIFYIFTAFLVIKRSSSLIAVSDYTAKHIRRYFKFRGKIKVVGNPILFENTNIDKKKNYDINAPVFMDISGWGRLKNIKKLLKAFWHVRATIPDAKLILYGQDLGKNEKGYDWARANNLDSNVEFRGFAKRLELNRALTDEADIFTHLSVVETFGNTIFEAIATGTPALISNIGAPPDILQHNECCKYINPHDVHEAEQNMLELVKTHGQDSEKMKELRCYLSSEYSADKIVEKLFCILTSISEQGGGR